MSMLKINASKPARVLSPASEVDIWMARMESRSNKLDQLLRLYADGPSPATRVADSPGALSTFNETRGLLQYVLHQYLDCAAEDVSFDYGLFGKPYLSVPEEVGYVHFSLAHGSGPALIAVSPTHRLGIDVERVGYSRDLFELGIRSLTRTEWERWSSRGGIEQQRLFYQYWVRKEAYLKGVGTGLTGPLDQVDVSGSSVESGTTVTIPLEDSRPTPWVIYDLDLSEYRPDLVAALAVEESGD